jgi:hypothetical protein
MISSEVQRTLVKSPPELWSELSDPAALARHLGELGEIRITRVEPERTVEWEAENTTGTVAIKPSGWGTRVTLTVNRKLPDPEPTVEHEAEPIAQAEPEPEREADPEPFIAPILVVEPDLPQWIVSKPAVAAGSKPAADAELAPQSERVDAPGPTSEPEPTPSRGFFARLFGRRRSEPPTERDMPEIVSAAKPERPELISAAEPVAEPTEPVAEPTEPVAEPTEPVAEPTEPVAVESLRAELATEAEIERAASEAEPDAPEQGQDISAELQAAEEIAAEKVTAVLTSVLDRLGAAHHRPFSRA